MNSNKRHLAVLAVFFVLTLIAGCSERDTAGLAPARGNMDPLVFDDDYGSDVYFQPFFQTHYTAVSMDSVYAYNGFAPDGARSLKVNVPPMGSALGPYSGGVITSGGARDLAGYNALTFYARSLSSDIVLNEVGFGNDNTGNSLFGCNRRNLRLSGDWVQYLIPIPDPSKLLSERGLFMFAEELQEEYPLGYDIWFDEIRFATVGIDSIRMARLTPALKKVFVGSSINIEGTFTQFSINGENVTVYHMPSYFDFKSSDESIATVNWGKIHAVGAGNDTITATVQGKPVVGYIIVESQLPPPAPAPAPGLPAGDVISLFSEAYTNVPVDTWRADWADGMTTQVQDYKVSGNATKMYSSLNWVGIQFLTRTVDAREMTHLHLDVYAPAGTNFKVELGYLPPDATEVVGTDGGLVFNATTTPGFVAGQWSRLDIPLAEFPLPEEGWDWANLGQLVLSSTDAKLVLVDNVLFHR